MIRDALAGRLTAFKASKRGLRRAPKESTTPDPFVLNCRQMLWHKRISGRAQDRRLLALSERYADKETSFYYWGVDLKPTSDAGAVAKLHLFITFAEDQRAVTKPAARVARAIAAGTWPAMDIATLRALIPVVKPWDNYCCENGCPTYRVRMLKQVIAYLSRPRPIDSGRPQARRAPPVDTAAANCC